MRKGILAVLIGLMVLLAAYSGLLVWNRYNILDGPGMERTPPETESLDTAPPETAPSAPVDSFRISVTSVFRNEFSEIEGSAEPVIFDIVTGDRVFSGQMEILEVSDSGLRFRLDGPGYGTAQIDTANEFFLAPGERIRLSEVGLMDASHTVTVEFLGKNITLADFRAETGFDLRPERGGYAVQSVLRCGSSYTLALSCEEAPFTLIIAESDISSTLAYFWSEQTEREDTGDLLLLDTKGHGMLVFPQGKWFFHLLTEEYRSEADLDSVRLDILSSLWGDE